MMILLSSFIFADELDEAVSNYDNQEINQNKEGVPFVEFTSNEEIVIKCFR